MNLKNDRTDTKDKFSKKFLLNDAKDYQSEALTETIDVNWR